MTLEQYDKLLASQHNTCATCLSDDPGSGRNWRIDHCHKTKKVRGLLCHKCNVALGLVNDNTVTLERMIKYLRR